MTPEQKARQEIDRKLIEAGWVIQDMKQLNLAAGIAESARQAERAGMTPEILDELLRVES